MADEIVLKTCNRCKEQKPIEEFYRCSRWRDGFDYSCKLCRKAMNLGTVKKLRSDKDKLAEFNRARREKRVVTGQRRGAMVPGRKLSRKEVKTRYRDKLLSDPVRLQEHRDKAREKGKQRYLDNKEEYVNRARSRDLRLKGVGGTHSCEAWHQLKELFGNRCLCCGEAKTLTKDHVVPVTCGGSDDITNIQPLCMLCNKAKFTQTVDYRSRAKVVLPELNAVGELIFNGDAKDKPTLEKHKTGSGFIGVYFDPKNENSVKVWRSKITVEKKTVELGRFETKEEAARAYNAAAIKYRGENTYLNAV